MALAHYRPSASATVTLDAGIWSAAGRPTVHVSIDLDPRLLEDWVDLASRHSPQTASIGLGKPALRITLT
jgi:hypothetical protein